MVEFTIETVKLVKKYPTTVRKALGRTGRRGWWRGSRSLSFSRLIDVMKGTKGPYIEALGGINLKVKKGETFGILGPNGAGKTTLIKILCTLVLHDSGEVYVNGYDVQKEPTEVLKNVQAVLPGSRGFSWRLSGRQNLEFYAQLYGLKQREAEDRIRYLLEFTGLNERAEDIYQRYSTGMQRKLLLCRALLRNTPILLFDEPTVGLDAASAGEFRDLLRNEMARGEQKTILLSTHNLVEAQEMCDRIAIIDQGKITACDTPDNIRYTLFEERPVHITFRDAWFDEKQAKTIEHLRTTEGVYGITPDIRPNNSLHGLALRVDKNLDLSHLLPILLQAELKIVTINTSEPTLEEAFIAITDQHSKIRNTRTTPRKE